MEFLGETYDDDGDDDASSWPACPPLSRHVVLALVNESADGNSPASELAFASGKSASRTRVIAFGRHVNTERGREREREMERSIVMVQQDVEHEVEQDSAGHDVKQGMASTRERGREFDLQHQVRTHKQRTRPCGHHLL